MLTYRALDPAGRQPSFLRSADLIPVKLNKQRKIASSKLKVNVQVHRVSQGLTPGFCIWGFRQLQMEMVEMGLSLVII